ncbi:MAG: nucleotide exchange factor GrpE [Atribacterota bacterium]|nr:nucleotide exchange factor GrpE [Atribacterota bacterium]MDD3640485.1 nucleotide exchange factor GrpE [Atribacterota bacterium]MDD4288717.1 nucleotide exchange factor GrpE [Atribacterota bacterium]MDD4764594.1 nucleotide exchange factor GrpE [Atribacterota bacterium]MDD5635862.1 nucleotide exchange factor GrpE [Atribacterota bacterium]
MNEKMKKDVEDKMNNAKDKYSKMKKNDLIEILTDKNDKINNLEAELDVLKDEFCNIKNNEKLYKNQLLRMQADFENYKKREEKKKKDFMEYANKDLICQLLSVIDNLERAALYSKNDDKNNIESVKEGIEGILKELHKILEKEGLKPINAVGEKFDPYCHEAIMQVESDKFPEDTVTEEITKGYYLKSNVIRPSVVKVSKGKKESC